MIILPFPKLPAPLEQDQLDALYPALRASDPKAKEAVIKGNIVTALGLAGRYKHSAHYHEFISEAMLQLTTAVENIINGAIDHHEGMPNIRGYIVTTVAGGLRLWRRRDRLFAINIKTLNKLRAKGLDHQGMVTLPDIEKAVEGEVSELLAIKEVMAKCVMSEFEKKVVALRAEGKDDVEISKELVCSKQHVHQTRGRIKERVVAMIGKQHERGRMGGTVRGSEPKATGTGSDNRDSGRETGQIADCA